MVFFNLINFFQLNILGTTFIFKFTSKNFDLLYFNCISIVLQLYFLNHKPCISKVVLNYSIFKVLYYKLVQL